MNSHEKSQANRRPNYQLRRIGVLAAAGTLVGGAFTALVVAENAETHSAPSETTLKNMQEPNPKAIISIVNPKDRKMPAESSTGTTDYHVTIENNKMGKGNLTAVVQEFAVAEGKAINTVAVQEEVAAAAQNLTNGLTAAPNGQVQAPTEFTVHPSAEIEDMGALQSDPDIKINPLPG